jgi:hypothetical protein
MKRDVTLLTEHAQVLFFLAQHPDWMVSQIAHALEASERQVFRWLNDLQQAGYLTRVKDGRRNRYVVRSEASLHEAPLAGITLSKFLSLAAGQPPTDAIDSDFIDEQDLGLSAPRAGAGSS